MKLAIELRCLLAGRGEILPGRRHAGHRLGKLLVDGVHLAMYRGERLGGAGTLPVRFGDRRLVLLDPGLSLPELLRTYPVLAAGLFEGELQVPLLASL